MPRSRNSPRRRGEILLERQTDYLFPTPAVIA